MGKIKLNESIEIKIKEAMRAKDIIKSIQLDVGVTNEELDALLELLSNWPDRKKTGREGTKNI